jgi:very-short-patch-repair endonuclease
MAKPVIQRARSLRRDAPFPERLLWSRLKNGGLGGLKFRRQHPVGPYFADFACADLKLIVELDGDTHGEDAQARHDAVRTRFLETDGWTVVRFWNAEVMESLEGTLDRIEDAARFLKHGK